MIASYEAELQSIQSDKVRMKAFILDMERQASAVQKMVDALPQERERISEAIQQRNAPPFSRNSIPGISLDYSVPHVSVREQPKRSLVTLRTRREYTLFR